MPIQPQYEVLDTLFQRKLFVIPNYQRAYSWRKAHRDDLFDDIETLASHPDTRHHFLASIVAVSTYVEETIGTTLFQTYEVVDGQQRLTTLVILLKAIANHLDDQVRIEHEEKQLLNSLLVKGDSRVVLLQGNHDSSLILRNYLEEGTVPPHTEITTIARKNVRDAIGECEAFVAGWKTRRPVLQLLSIIKNRLGFVFYQLSDRGSVYTVFEVLNSRGLDVEHLDKCKSMLMGIAYEKMPGDIFAQTERELHQIWTDIFRLLGRRQINGDEILMFASTLFGGEERARRMNPEDSVESFREQCLLDPRKTIVVSQRLQRVTAKIVELEEKPEWSAVTKIVHARLLAIAILLRSDIIDKSRLLEQWENVSFRIFGMQGKDSRSKGGEYTKLATNIMAKTTGYISESEILGQLIVLGRDHPVAESVIFLTNTDCYNGWENDFRYFIFKYERFLSQSQGARISEEAWNKIWAMSPSKSIEHIYPQHPGLLAPRLQNHDANIHRIGNLTILTPELNSEASNLVFERKKEKYRNSGLLVNRSILLKPDGTERNQWLDQEIALREAELLAFAQIQWKDLQ